MKDATINIETVFNAPVEKVWAAWTGPHLILKWIGSDPNGKGVIATMNVQVGGAYEITFEDSDRTQHTCMGRYLIVQKPKILSFTWEWKSEPGVESLVTLKLNPEKSKTSMIFEHGNVGIASAHNYMTGWKATFSKLERMLSEMSISQGT